MQVLQGRWDRTFSEHSFGFRPGRSAHQAVAKAQECVALGNHWVVDIDLEKFFDRVNHDILMGRIARRVADKRCPKLIRAFLLPRQEAQAPCGRGKECGGQGGGAWVPGVQLPEPATYVH